MYKIIQQLVKRKGNEVIVNQDLVSLVEEKGGFSDTPMKLKKILEIIIQDGYSQKLLDCGSWNDEAQTLIVTCSQRNKLQKNDVEYVFSCLAYGLSWLKKAPQLQNAAAAPLPMPTSRIAAQQKAQEEEAKRRLDAENARRKAEEEAKRKAEEAERARKKAEAEEARRKAEEERKKEEERKRKEEEAKRKAEEAERARKKAEEEARKRVQKDAEDREAARKAMGIISDIGAVTYSEECQILIRKAEEAYAALTLSQKGYVENFDVLYDAKKKFEWLKDATEEEARKKVEERKKEEERKRKEEEAKRKAEEAERARKKVEDEARRKAEEKARKKAEELKKKRTKTIRTLLYIVGVIATMIICLIFWPDSSENDNNSNSEYDIYLEEDENVDPIDVTYPSVSQDDASVKSESTKNDWKRKYDYVYALSNGVYKVEKRDKVGFCDETGKEVLPPVYDYIYALNNGVYKVEKRDKVGFVDAKTYKELTPCEYDYIYPASGELIKVEKGDKVGFLNAKTYKLVTPCIYDYMYPLSNGLIKVEIGDKIGYLNADGSIAKQPK